MKLNSLSIVLCIQAWYTAAFNLAVLLAYCFEVCVYYIITEFFKVCQSSYALNIQLFVPDRSKSSSHNLIPVAVLSIAVSCISLGNSESFVFSPFQCRASAV